MGGQLTQSLGFDASKAIQALTNLDKSMGSFEQHLSKAVKSMDAFNKKGGGTVGLLKRMATEGERAAKALAKVAGLQGQLGGAGGGVGGRGGAPTPTNVPGVDQYIKQLKTMHKVSAKATTAQKRAFQSAITSAAEFAAKNKVSIGQVVSQSKNLDQSFTGTANTMANKLSKIEQASKKHLNAAGQSVRKLSVDFQTMVRIVTTQAIVRALSQLRNLIRGAVQDAVEFQTRIAEVGTIAPTDDLGDLANRVREISDAFNTPLDTTAKGYYQTISNQIGDTTGEFDTFVKAAAKFSKTSVTDLASAVNLGSGALNAFGKSANEAEDTFAKFFVTIKQGRVIGSELAQGFGSVSPLADKLGVSMEELNASLATITIQGIAADKAFTQLRGIFNSFLKPTKEMTEALHQLGFASGQDILEAHDLQTALRLVAGTTDGTAQGMSKLIPRVRGLTGGLALVGDETEHFTETIKAQGEALQEVYGKGHELVMETDAQKVTKELNKLKNYLTTEFGESVLQSAGKLLQFVGGAEQLEKVFNAIGPQIPKIVLGFGALATGLGLVALKAKLATLGLAGLLGPIGALALVPAALALGSYIGNETVDSFDAEFQEFDRAMKKQLEARKEKVNAEIALEKQKVDKLISVIARGLAEGRKEYFEVTQAAVDANEKQLANLKFFTDGIIREAERAAQASRAAFESAGKNVLASEQRVGKLQSSLDDKLFSSRIKKQKDVRKVFELTQRSAALASSAASKLKSASTEGQRSSANEEFRRAAAFAEQAVSIAEGTKKASLERQALAAIESVTKKNISAEKVYQQTLASTQQQMAKRAQVEEKRVVDLKKKQTELLDAFTLYDQQTGELLSTDERADKLKSAQKSLHEFIQMATKDKPLDVGSMLNFASLSQQMTRELTGFRINEIQVSAAAIQTIHDTVQSALNQQYDLNPQLRALSAFTGVELTGQESEREALEKLRAEYDRLIDVKGEYRLAGKEIASADRSFAQALKEVDASSHGVGAGLAAIGAQLDSTLGTPENLTFFNNITDAMELMKKASDGGQVSMKEFQDVVKRLQSSESQQTKGSQLLSLDFKTDLNNALVKLRELIQAKEQASQVQADELQLRSYDEVQQRIQQIEAMGFLNTPKQNAEAMGAAVVDVTSAVNQSLNPVAQLAEHWRTMAANAQTVATASGRIGTQTATAAHGGTIRYLASGGFARGMDQIPAMLSKDEFVTNARSSRKFYSQLSAMNAGVQPVYRESGGTVTNIGDVSINVTESGSPKQTARQVMSAFRREMRRGSSRL